MILCNLICIIFCFVYNIETGKIRPNFNEIFDDGWDKKQSEKNVIKNEQNDENGQNEIIIHFVDQLDGENGIGPNDQRKIETIYKFEEIKMKLKEMGKYQGKNRLKIEAKIGKLLGTNRDKIYKWKKELNLNKNAMKKSFYYEKKKEFIVRFDEFKELYGQGKQKEFVKELGISIWTFRKWKKELMPKKYNKSSKNKYSNEDRIKKMKQYFKIKERNSKITDEIIAEKLGILNETMRKWKKKFASFI